jgi:hypothetical protein
VRKAQRWRCVESDKPSRRPHKCEFVPGNNKCRAKIIRVKGANSTHHFYRPSSGQRVKAAATKPLASQQFGRET